MIGIEKSNVYASGLRKKFNKENKILSGDLVRIGKDGLVGIFQGISTFRNPSQITINMYRLEDGIRGHVNILPISIHILPKYFEYLGKLTPVISFIQDKPNTPQHSYW